MMVNGKMMLSGEKVFSNSKTEIPMKEISFMDNFKAKVSWTSLELGLTEVVLMVETFKELVDWITVMVQLMMETGTITRNMEEESWLKLEVIQSTMVNGNVTKETVKALFSRRECALSRESGNMVLW
jgi:hypothetical protein